MLLKIRSRRVRVLTRLLSADKGIEEKEYEFAFDLFEEVIPEVRSPRLCRHLPR